jgi:DNA segregation ATPase FtsK/SpoIIIE-like protein
VAKARGDMLAEIRERTGTPVEKWDPAQHGPVLVVVIDELAELVRQSKKVRKNAFPPKVMEAIKFIASNFETAVQVYRALGIQIVMATQSPDSSITSGDGKGGIDQIQNLVCFQTSKVSQTNIILGPGAHGDGYRAHIDLYVPGMFYMRTPAVKIPVKYKGYYVSNDEIVEYVERYADTRPTLDARSAEAAASVLGDVGATPRTTPPGGSGNGAPGEPQDTRGAVPYLRAVPDCYPNGSEIDEKHRALWELLDTFEQGVTVSELAAAAQAAGHENCSLAWVRDVCKLWRTGGSVGFGIEGRDYRYWRDDEAIKRRMSRGA